MTAPAAAKTRVVWFDGAELLVNTHDVVIRDGVMTIGAWSAPVAAIRFWDKLHTITPATDDPLEEAATDA